MSAICAVVSYITANKYLTQGMGHFLARRCTFVPVPFWMPYSYASYIPALCFCFSASVSSAFVCFIHYVLAIHIAWEFIGSNKKAQKHSRCCDSASLCPSLSRQLFETKTNQSSWKHTRNNGVPASSVFSLICCFLHERFWVSGMTICSKTGSGLST